MKRVGGQAPCQILQLAAPPEPWFDRRIIKPYLM